MTLLHFVIVSVFTIVCITVTYINQRRLIQVMKERDLLLQQLDNLIRQNGYYYPEGLHKSDPHIVSAKKALVSVVKGQIGKS